MTAALPPMLFLSHAGVDSDRALSLATAIEASPDAVRLGLKVWIDKRDLRPGTSWQQQLEYVIEKQSTAFGILLTGQGRLIPLSQVALHVAPERQIQANGASGALAN